MRKLIVIEFVTLDGVMQGLGSPDEDRDGGFEHGGWAAPFFDENQGAAAVEGLKSTTAYLFGRRTYEKMIGYWPSQPDENPMAAHLNATPKYVATRTLTSLTWSNSQVLDGELVPAVRQYWVIALVSRHESEMGYDRHPIGMTMQFPVRDQTKVNDTLFGSRAEWISPGYDDEIFAGGGHPMAPGSPQSRWLENPPAADGRKVVISDTDHYAPGRGDALWAWKSFLRGHHPILMDFGLIGGINPPDPSAGGPMSYAAFEPARHAMGDTLRFAERMNLIEMEPREDLSSTGYALANPGQEYLVLQPGGAADPFTVVLEPGTYSAEWFSVQRRETIPAQARTVERSTPTGFSPPASAPGPAVLYLRRAG
jgi:hypothetical protein